MSFRRIHPYSVTCALLGLACTSPAETSDPSLEPPPLSQAEGAPNPAGDPSQPPENVPPPPITRIVAIGDTGKANTGQRAVADAIGVHCDRVGGCDAMLMLGDNFYPDGVESVDDPQWQSKFEDMYGDLGIPVWAALGNHDYGNTTFEWFRGPVQVAYSDRSEVFNMPSTFYTVVFKNVGVVVLDTDSLMWDRTAFGDQRDWYSDAVASLGTDWVIVIGHHPYRSNGRHGNAGRYEGLPGLPIVSGAGVKSFFDQYVCGSAHLYLSGHDHSRQWLQEPWCGTELVVSGAGATTTDVVEDRNRYYWQDGDAVGFLYLEIQGDRLTGQFLDVSGNVEFERTLER